MIRIVILFDVGSMYEIFAKLYKWKFKEKLLEMPLIFYYLDVK